MDYAVTLDQTLRFGYNLSRFTNDNLGVGGYDEPERAYSNENTHAQRARAALRSARPARLLAFAGAAVRRRLRRRVSATQAPTIRVNDSFTSGGAQLAGGEHSKRLNFASDLDYVRGRQSLRARHRARRRLVPLGRVGELSGHLHLRQPGRVPRQPARATTRGASAIRTCRISNVQFGVYMQDDIRLRKNLTLSPGVRYEAQSHVGGAANIGPRFGVTWAPIAGGQTTLRASTGIFYDWLPTATYEQSLRVDGVRQQEMNIFDPSYPDPGGARHRCRRSTVPARRRLSHAAHHAGQRRHRPGLPKVNRVSLTYSYQQGVAPGARPEPQHAGERRPARSGVPQHRRGRVGRRVASASGAVRRQHQSRRAAAGVQGTAASAGSGRRCSSTIS